MLVFANDGGSRKAAVLNDSANIAASGTSHPALVNPSYLADFDAFYAGSEFERYLDSKGAVLQDFLSGGDGIVVGQADVTDAEAVGARDLVA